MRLLGMAGFAEGIICFELALMGLGVLLVMLCAVLGLGLRFRSAAVAGLILVTVTAYLFQPWEAFKLEPTDDTDAQNLQGIYIWWASWWVVASIAAAAGAIRAFWRPRCDTQPLKNLTVEDLARCPIWRYEGPSDDTASVSPAAAFEHPDREVYIARTRFVLADGSEWWGYCSPIDDSGLDYVQPVLLTPSGPVRFWYDESPAEPEPARTCRLLGRPPERVFPVRFECVVPVEGRVVGGELPRIDTPSEQSTETDGPSLRVELDEEKLQQGRVR
jgi:hypothetical protein